jgi:hypothetical protein
VAVTSEEEKKICCVDGSITALLIMKIVYVLGHDAAQSGEYLNNVPEEPGASMFYHEGGGNIS